MSAKAIKNRLKTVNQLIKACHCPLSFSNILPADLPWLERVRIEIHHHTVLLGLTLGYCAIAVAYMSNRGIYELPVFMDYAIGGALPLLALVAFRTFGEITYHVLHVRPFQVAGIWRGIRQSEIFSPERVAAAFIPVLLLPVFSSVFTSFKTSIPEMTPFSWDHALMVLDRTLHGGHQPWDLLQPLLGFPVVTALLGLLYNVWQGMILIVYWQMLHIHKRRLRMQFLISFVLAWSILGSLGAFVFASAGPCYYGHVVPGPNPYDGLMQYLYSAHEVMTNRSILAQEYLWQLYEKGLAGLGGGISAMPSLHVAVALLVFLLMRQYGRLAAWVSGLYVGVVVVSSIHLGWHYAVDGYAGLIGGFVAWHVAGYLVRRFVRPPPPATDETAA